MALSKNVGGKDRLLRAIGAVLLTITAVRALRAGRRPTGVLAALGAVGLGFNASVCFCGLNAALGIDTSDD
ncbi:MAG: protein of unknown function (DUF2892) [Halonotius sp. J07HN6]|jgi:Protein of unknown function (DUF2892).|nr:MAG: protein of unknown function (DUF2892) [Halonotius sp. J07HN6]ERH05426.1 MAG: protein of unknown function (DUF2892) [Halonotius sp. J07HN4]